MMRKLDVLVPVLDEGEEVIRPLLDSIAVQQGVDLENDIGVVVCCDGGTTRLSDGFIAGYPFHVEFHVLDHGGVSATRNACLDRSEADYVMFADCDDMFCDVCGLYVVFREIDNGGVDTLVSNFREETRGQSDRTRPVYVNHEMDSTFVHGKVHRRGYLVDNQIRFDPRLKVHEDSYFNILAQNLTDNAKYCATPFYLWKWRESSVCRHDPDYVLKTYGNLIDSNDALVDEFVRRMMPDKANGYCAFMVFDAYYTMNKPEWLDKTHADYRRSVERRFAEYFAKHRDKWESLSSRDKAVASAAVRNRSVVEGMLMEAVTIGQWLEKIGGEDA